MTIVLQHRHPSHYVFTLLGLLLLAACSSTPKPAKCDENEGEYLRATQQTPLRVPENLTTPDRRNALNIPADNGAALDKHKCYERAPAYFGTAGRIAASPEETVADWAQAWAERNGAAVMAMYSSAFITEAPDGSAAWLAQRAKEVAEGPLPAGRVSNLKITQQGSDLRLATFTQHFGSTQVIKLLKLVREAGVWRINSEQVVSTETKAAKY